jgi:nitric oxide reductase NorE protein
MSTLLDTVPKNLNGSANERAPARRRHVPGEVGTWVFILGDMTVFALLFAVYVYYRGKAPHVFAQSQKELHRSFGAINTLLLLTSSLCVITAVRAVRANMRKLSSASLAVAFICGCGFLTNKVLEWSGLVAHGHGPGTNNFFMYFFVLTGIHAFHLLLGMGALITLFVFSRKKSLSAGQYAFFEGGACFWHMVDLLWVVLFALLYLMH